MKGRAMLCSVTLLAVAAGQSYQLPDAGIGIYGGQPGSGTVLSQIQDSAEREGFQAMFRKQPAAVRLEAAEAFLATFPQSWYLAQAWEVKAKACMEQENWPCAVEAGKQSLRLLPENPLLLVPVANAQVTLGDTKSATRSALDALEQLDRFSRPRLFTEKSWTEQAISLRASCHYVLGKAALTEALAVSGEEKRKKLEEADRHLSGAQRLAPGDDRIAYILGLVREAEGKPREAGIAFAAAYGRNGPFQPKLEDHLRKLHEQQPAAVRTSWEEFVAQLKRQASAAASKPELPGALKTSPSEYSDTAVCRQCHLPEYEGWRQTGHAKMFAPYRPENVIGDFNHQEFRDEKGQTVARMTLSNGRHYFQVRGARKEWLTYQVDYTIGSKWQQTYATRLPNGEIHVFPLQYNALQRRWVAFWKLIDPPATARDDPDNFFRHTPDTAYVSNCAPCHTSQLRKSGSGPATPSSGSFREGGINCEQCHGPGARHVEAMRTVQAGGQADLQMQRFGRVSARDFVGFCALCHMQSAERTEGARGECNFVDGGAPYYPRFLSTPYTEFMRRAFWKDGRFRVVNFIVEAFERTSCYRKGEAHCGYCHDLHPDDARTNDRSLKAQFLQKPDYMCVQCHANYNSRAEAHTHHKRDSAGSRCVSCHMPRIMDTVLFQARSHQIDDIPDPAMTARFGRQDSPNACLICHEEKDASWAATVMAGWYGKRFALPMGERAGR